MAVSILVTAATAAVAADVLFPEPLHLVRRIEDPLADRAVELEEFCSGNRIVTVASRRTVIADYARRELIEIDRGAGTYSVTPFSGIVESRAAARPAPNRLVAQAHAADEAPILRAVPPKPSLSGRSAEWFEISPAPGQPALAIAVDRQITLSREALEVLSGGFPEPVTPQALVIGRACRRPDDAAARSEERYGLPLEQVLAFDDDEQRHLTVRNSIVRVDRELPPPEIVAIPAGARLVPSARTLLPRMLNELDTGATPNRP